MFEKHLDGDLKPLASEDRPNFTYLLTMLTDANVEATAKLLNSEWPRSLGQRCVTLLGLTASNGDLKLPISLILVHRTAQADLSVIGHSSLSPIATLPKVADNHDKQNLIFLQSLIIDKAFRGKGLGRVMMQYSEEYVLSYFDHLRAATTDSLAKESSQSDKATMAISLANTRFDHLYLTTHDKQAFYESIGYERTEPVAFYSIKTGASRCNQIMQALLSKMAEQNEPEPVMSSKLKQTPQPALDLSSDRSMDKSVTWYRKHLIQE